MNIQEQLEELSQTVKCTIKPSKIAGVGVFSIMDIKKGERLYLIPQETRRWYSVPFGKLSELKPEIRQIVLDRWPSVVNGSLFQHPHDEIWLTSFVNHADSPNDNYNIDTDSAKCDIPAGTEVTENYRTMKNYQTVYPWLK